MTNLKEKPVDQGRIVASLAHEFHAPVEAVARLYEHERATLAAGATITQFLHIFATRHVEDILRKRLAVTGAATGG